MSGGDAPEYGEVSLADHGVRSYLVKMPQFLINEFEDEARAPGSVVGRLRIPEPGAMAPNPDPNPDGDVAVEVPQIFIDQPVEADSTNPRDYKLFFPDEPADIVLLSWRPKGDDPSLRVEGRVAHQCDARPPLNAAYRNINRRRVAEAEDNRETVHMDEGERIAAQNKSVRVTALAETAAQKEERHKKKEKARKHLDVPGEEYREAVKTAVFRAFEAKLHYGAEELSKVVDEPMPTLRRVLNEICMYNKAGAFSGKYELREEFKTVAQREQKRREVEDHRSAEIDDVKRRREERAVNEREKSEPALKKTRFN